MYFPTCQVRVVRFHVRCRFLLFAVLLFFLFFFFFFFFFFVVVLSALHREPLGPVLPVGPQPRAPVLSVPCRTSTATICAQCSLPDLNREIECQKECQKVCQKDSERMSEDMPERMSGRMSGDMPERMRDRMSGDLSERMSEDLSERMSDRMSEDMSERMSGRMSGDMPERMSERVSEEMSERMSEDMSEEMSEIISQDMSERMSSLGGAPNLTMDDWATPRNGTLFSVKLAETKWGNSIDCLDSFPVRTLWLKGSAFSSSARLSCKINDRSNDWCIQFNKHNLCHPNSLRSSMSINHVSKHMVVLQRFHFFFHVISNKFCETISSYIAAS